LRHNSKEAVAGTLGWAEAKLVGKVMLRLLLGCAVASHCQFCKVRGTAQPELAQSIFNRLRPYLDRAGYVGMPICFAGHSLGGWSKA
jgi:hypothetical protein